MALFEDQGSQRYATAVVIPSIFYAHGIAKFPDDGGNCLPSTTPPHCLRMQHSHSELTQTPGTASQTKVTNLKVAIHTRFTRNKKYRSGVAVDTGRAAVAHFSCKETSISCMGTKHMTGLSWRESLYHDMALQPSMVKKSDGTGGCAGTFTDLNNACPQIAIHYEIDWKVDPYAETPSMLLGRIQGVSPNPNGQG
ncbi:hypothetical protein Tco_1482660 [Tanacetum coccineum]